jgi:ubiquinone/menaquinone biosynthesis C-methylase UbiE
MNKRKIEKFWDKNAPRYDESEKKSESVYQEIIERTTKYLSLNDHVLDFGCATGNKTIALAGKVRHIHGIDISPGMIGLANQKKAASKVPNVTFSSGTIFDEELQAASFDRIVSQAVVHLLEDKEAVIRRIYQLLKPGGLFISATPCFKDKMTFKKRIEVTLYVIMQRLGIFPLHLNMFTIRDVENIMTDQHFKIIEAEKIFHEISISYVVAQKVQISPAAGT